MPPRRSRPASDIAARSCASSSRQSACAADARCAAAAIALPAAVALCRAVNAYALAVAACRGSVSRSQLACRSSSTAASDACCRRHCACAATACSWPANSPLPARGCEVAAPAVHFTAAQPRPQSPALARRHAMRKPRPRRHLRPAAAAVSVQPHPPLPLGIRQPAIGDAVFGVQSHCGAARTFALLLCICSRRQPQTPTVWYGSVCLCTVLQCCVGRRQLQPCGSWRCYLCQSVGCALTALLLRPRHLQPQQQSTPRPSAFPTTPAERQPSPRSRRAALPQQRGAGAVTARRGKKGKSREASSHSGAHLAKEVGVGQVCHVGGDLKDAPGRHAARIHHALRDALPAR